MDGTDNIDTIIIISALQPIEPATMTIFDMAGSSGNSTICLPNSVSSPVLSKAPNIQSWYIEFIMLSLGGGDLSNRITLDKLVRCISGTLVLSISSRKFLSEYKRKHCPGPVRPALPARCAALA
ncbi:hypothetical protein BpHYR1_007790 [Brachionus plicatilis]|uniref:Uncharacterized protein n=1 Tax=Brachionus plicatilis TaxID=10195 RepID=A0A3M7PR39_BRAPC|nr:hypothetical protein BpHYR1_007790 [Brachionus plicatilis]